jgi:hypothetical protein
MADIDPVVQLAQLQNKIVELMTQSQGGAKVPGLREKLTELSTELQQVQQRLAGRPRRPEVKPRVPSEAEKKLEARAATTAERAADVKKRAEERMANRLKGPLDHPPEPFTGDQGLDAKTIQGLIDSLVHGLAKQPSKTTRVEDEGELWEDWNALGGKGGE